MGNDDVISADRDSKVIYLVVRFQGMGKDDVVTADRDSKVWKKMTSSLLTGMAR
jgi:hypothetical protein